MPFLIIHITVWWKERSQTEMRSEIIDLFIWGLNKIILINIKKLYWFKRINFNFDNAADNI